jgi:hypothetical protein
MNVSRVTTCSQTHQISKQAYLSSGKLMMSGTMKVVPDNFFSLHKEYWQRMISAGFHRIATYDPNRHTTNHQSGVISPTWFIHAVGFFIYSKLF